jgi:hypothetical protein
MERELWKVVYHRLKRVARHFDQKYVHLRPWRVAAVLLWAALHDRPVGWACDKRNWSTTRLRPGRVPSAATVSRRAREAASHLFLNALAADRRGGGPPAWALVVDGKPLPVGKCSKDPDARPGPHGKGYKLHALWGARCLPEGWEVTAARDYEGAVAERLLGQVRGAGVLLADGSYEASRLYDAAAASGYQLLARPVGQDTGGGHVYQSPHRRVALAWFADGPGSDLYRGRAAIERPFGNAGSFGGGLGPLPNWVRRFGRVSRWVWCKLVINAARILHRRQPKERLQ